MNTQTDTAAALHTFLETWTGEMAADVAGALSCTEADALAQLLRAHGRRAAAAEWINQHSKHDQPEEAHHRAPALALRFELDELAANVETVEVTDEDPETFGAGHQVIYRNGGAARFAITERTDKPADDETRDVIGWDWDTAHRDEAGAWHIDASGSADADDLDSLTLAAWTWATR